MIVDCGSSTSCSTPTTTFFAAGSRQSRRPGTGGSVISRDYARARPWLREAADLVVDTGERSIVETADDIAAAVPIST